LAFERRQQDAAVARVGNPIVSVLRTTTLMLPFHTVNAAGDTEMLELPGCCGTLA
jgi:hypothetical protein